MEELEAVDWYGQRVDACGDAELRRVLAHNRDEEKEHACMTLEWVRRRDPTFDALLRRFLFASESESIVGVEHGDGDDARPAEPTLGIGALTGEAEEDRP
jgi:hypothetical protein